MNLRVALKIDHSIRPPPPFLSLSVLHFIANSPRPFSFLWQILFHFLLSPSVVPIAPHIPILISQVDFSPCGQLVAAGSSDPRFSSVILLNSLTWRRVTELPMTSSFVIGASGTDDKEKKKNNNAASKHSDEVHHPCAVLYKEIKK